jgi:vancomycin resistance protein VanW
MRLKRRLSEIHPFFFHTRVAQLRLDRYLRDVVGRVNFAEQRDPEPLPATIKRHQSLLRRRLGDSDPELQENKVVNLGIAAPTIHGLRIAPGETFSLWRCVGPPTAERGYVEGLQLSRGEVRRGVGGGLCQLANLFYWMALHSPLQVAERHHHSFDPFPDEQRVLPFGSGAGIFYNYVDLRLHNPHKVTFGLEVWLTEQHIKGRLACQSEWPFTYKVEEREHRFFRRDEKIYRANELWRRSIDRRTGQTSGEELLMSNCAEVKYPVSDDQLTSLSHVPGLPGT